MIRLENYRSVFYKYDSFLVNIEMIFERREVSLLEVQKECSYLIDNEIFNIVHRASVELSEIIFASGYPNNLMIKKIKKDIESRMNKINDLERKFNFYTADWIQKYSIILDVLQPFFEFVDWCDENVVIQEECKIDTNQYPEMFIGSSNGSFEMFEEFVAYHIVDPYLGFSFIYQQMKSDNYIHKCTHVEFIDWLKKHDFISEKEYDEFRIKRGFYSLGKCSSEERLGYYYNLENKYFPNTSVESEKTSLNRN